ncbi:conserved hypothetical protein [Tenacibaculum litopenaei]|uniref:hypothetical protein n=1 Tax=Tenacibaculum litopenaei TaxID=396016 RepID=UPI003893583E
MKRSIWTISLLLLTVLGACDLITLKKQRTQEEKPIASVYNKHLYKRDIANLVPKNISKQDSLVFVKGLINNWAKKQLFLIKAEENITEVNSLEIEKLVNDYKASLYINGYKEKLIKQKLDTVVSESELQTYYLSHKDNFKLSEGLLQYDYLYFDKDHLEREEIVKLFKSDDVEDRESLEKFLLSLKSYRLHDSTWVSVRSLKSKILPFANESKENLLKISKFIQKEDSLGVYLVAVNNILQKNQVAPLSEVEGQIRQIILHKRKLELIREIEKTLINDAIQNKNFKEY